MEDTHLVLDLVLVLGIALIGGFVARRLHQPVVLGYVIAGILLGPNTPLFKPDRVQVDLLASIGVAFLMFALGVEFSLTELSRVRRAALIGGGLQVPVTIGLGAIAGQLAGWSWQASVLLGGGFALSSSIFALTLLVRRGEIDAPHGKVTMGLMVFQDLALIPMIALLPVLSGDSDDLASTLITSLLIAAVALAAVVFLGTRIVPRLLFMVAKSASKELFLITIVVIALGTALASERAGLSLALGAFLAGLVVSESEFDREVLSEIAPLRDLFSTLFFVAIGMLLVPRDIWNNILLVTGLIGLLIVGKIIITTGSFLIAGVNARTAVLSAVVVAQMGEFSFVLAGEGLHESIITSEQYGLILAVAVGSIIATPFVSSTSPFWLRLVERLPGIRGQNADLLEIGVERDSLVNHVIICGYGRVGAVLGQSLERRGFTYAVVELNPSIVRQLQSRGIPAFYGDAGQELVLRNVGSERAKVLVVTTTDLISSPTAIKVAKRVNPKIAVITRAIASTDVQMLRNVGADEIIQPEFEAGLECVRYVLREFGVSIRETTTIINSRRADHYQHLDGESGPDPYDLPDPFRLPPDVEKP
ncbi:N/A [soil metagenome]